MVLNTFIKPYSYQYAEKVKHSSLLIKPLL